MSDHVFLGDLCISKSTLFLDGFHPTILPRGMNHLVWETVKLVVFLLNNVLGYTHCLGYSDNLHCQIICFRGFLQE